MSDESTDPSTPAAPSTAKERRGVTVPSWLAVALVAVLALGAGFGLARATDSGSDGHGRPGVFQGPNRNGGDRQVPQGGFPRQLPRGQAPGSSSGPNT